ncbi:MAG: phasin family protein [Candidatus Xenobia bacterium]
MDFNIEKLFLAGLGAGLMAKERVEDTLNQLVNKGELTKEQARNLVDDMSTKAESEKDKFQVRGREELRKFFGEQNLVFVEDLRKLETRLAALEEKLKLLTEKDGHHAPSGKKNEVAAG